jgi:alpha-beta hydrolase superfamily lysophospholipase
MDKVISKFIRSRTNDLIKIFEAKPLGDDCRVTIILGNGIGGTMDCSNKDVAQTFSQHGYRAIAFDYRHFGESQGQPRQHFSINKQLQDWDSVIHYAKSSSQGGDAQKIVLWGTSFGGSHVLTLGAEREDIDAIIAQCPNVDFFETVISTDFIRLSKLTFNALLDLFLRQLGRKPKLIPLVGKPDSSALMITDDAQYGYPEHAAKSRCWKNEITAGFALFLFLYRPIKKACFIKAPLLVCVCNRDSIANPQLAKQAALIARRGKSLSYDCDHFELYEQRFSEQAFKDQLSFLNENGMSLGETHDK